MGLLRLLLQDLPKLVFANAAEKRARVMGLLDHPLGRAKTATHQTNKKNPISVEFLGELPAWAIFIEFWVAPPAWYSTLNFFTSSSNLQRNFHNHSFFLILGTEIIILVVSLRAVQKVLDQ